MRLSRVPPPLCSPTLTSQSALIADFTRSGPIAARGGRDLDRSRQEEAGRGEGGRGGGTKGGSKVSEAFAARKHVNRIKY